MENNNYLISPAQETAELKMQQGDQYLCKDYQTLWTMFHAVVETSSWGTSEFGGPVWIMDFSLDNLKKFFPGSLWLSMLEEERNNVGKDSDRIPPSSIISHFYTWFQSRIGLLIENLGLGNVIVKYEKGIYGGHIAVYGWGIFLDILRELVGGKVHRLDERLMADYDFSFREVQKVKQGNFLTKLSGGMVAKFPCGHGRSFYYTKPSAYGDCLKLHHFSLTKGWVIPEKIPEKFLMLIINDLMECKAQGYGNKADQYGNVCPYPQMKHEEYLYEHHSLPGYHFKKTEDKVFFRRDGFAERVEVKIPTIDPKYGPWWHRQFPPKQNWQEL